jgi:hypothetical protein
MDWEAPSGVAGPPDWRAFRTPYTARRCNDSPSALCAPATRAAQRAWRPVPTQERWNEGRALLEDAPSRRGRRSHGVAARAGVRRPGPSVFARGIPSLALGPGILPGRRRQRVSSAARAGVCRPGRSAFARCVPSLPMGPSILPGRRRQRFPSCAPGGGSVRLARRPRSGAALTLGPKHVLQGLGFQDSVGPGFKLGLARLNQALLGPRWQGPEAPGVFWLPRSRDWETIRIGSKRWSGASGRQPILVAKWGRMAMLRSE